MIEVEVETTNPGIFFGCCGLFELAHRVWPEAQAHFADERFVVSTGDLGELVQRIADASLIALEPGNETSSALLLQGDFALHLDWWKTERGLKTWAGRMSVNRIAIALQQALPAVPVESFFNHSQVVIGADGKKVEPFYFDGRRGATALPLDMGFSTDELKLPTAAHPAVEFLTLIGLQRFRPMAGENRPRLFRYRTWSMPLPIRLAALAASTVIPGAGQTFQFESAFRTTQRKHKAFTPAVPNGGDWHDRE